MIDVHRLGDQRMKALYEVKQIRAIEQAAAAQLGGDGGEAVLQAARNAFAGGFRLAVGISAALMLLTAVLSANLLSAPLHTAMRNEPAE